MRFLALNLVPRSITGTFLLGYPHLYLLQDFSLQLYFHKIVLHLSNASFCFSLFRKGRRKDKDSPTPAPEEYRLYLEDQYVRDSCVSDADLLELIDEPRGLCHDEWLATHSK
jgi:hypothetical protein